MGDDDVVDKVMEEADKSRLNSVVAILVSITATFMAICHVKGDNVVQHMHEIDAQVVDQWAYYQAKSTKENIVKVAADEMRVMSTNGATSAAAAMVAKYNSEAARYEKEKDEIKTKIDEIGKQHDEFGVQDDQFDLTDAALSIAIALFAITSLTQKRGLLVVAAVFALLGIAFGIAGFIGVNIHPAWVMRVIG